MKRKVLIMMNSLYGGGAERVLQVILSHLNYEKFDVTVYSLHQEPIDYMLYSPKAKYRYLFSKSAQHGGIKENIKQFWQKIKGKCFCLLPSKYFYRLFIHSKYDVEVAFIEGESTKIISGSTNPKSKKIAWVHIDLEKNPWTAFLYHSIADESAHYQNYHQILCVSNEVAQSFCRKYDVDPKKVRTQYNPIDPEEIRLKAALPCELPPKNRTRMVAVGRLVSQKGFDRLLRITKRLADAGLDFELFILGEGSERPQLEKYVSEYQLEHHVTLLGYCPNPYPYMNSADMIVCSSRAEGFSTVLTEAVILGLPIISTECAGTKEILGDPSCGIITENREDALYECLLQVLSSPEQLHTFALASQRRGETFCLNTIMQQIEDRLYESID